MSEEKDLLVRRFMRIRDWLYGNPKGDSTEECLRVAVVVIRYPQKCCSVYHGAAVKTYPAGTLMIKENMIIPLTSSVPPVILILR